MAVLGQIRKRSIFLIIVIGMALFAFVISGVFTSNGGFGSNKPIGEINGEEINYETFNMMVEQAQNAYGLNILNAVNLAWDQGVKNQALLQELDKLGIDAGKDQLEQIISSDQSIVLNPLFQNEIGLFDFNKFSSYISQLKSSNPTLYDQWRFQELNIISLAKQKIYFGNTDNMEIKFKKLELFYKNILPTKGWNYYESVNLKFKNQIVCKKSSNV